MVSLNTIAKTEVLLSSSSVTAGDGDDPNTCSEHCLVRMKVLLEWPEYYSGRMPLRRLPISHVYVSDARQRAEMFVMVHLRLSEGCGYEQYRMGRIVVAGDDLYDDRYYHVITNLM